MGTTLAGAVVGTGVALGAAVAAGAVVAPGAAVADVGSGEGYLTWHLAARAGVAGVVYAVDIDDEPLAKLRDAAQSKQLSHVHTVRGEFDDPRLDAESLDAAVIVDTYHF